MKVAMLKGSMNNNKLRAFFKTPLWPLRRRQVLLSLHLNGTRGSGIAGQPTVGYNLI